MTLSPRLWRHPTLLKVWRTAKTIPRGRVTTYGRAFADPEKGAQGSALSMRQGVKLKEITQKAKGKTPMKRTGFKRKDP